MWRSWSMSMFTQSCAEQFESAMQVDAHGVLRQAAQHSDLASRTAFDQPKCERLSVSVGQLVNCGERLRRLRPEIWLVPRHRPLVERHFKWSAPNEVNGAVPGDRRNPTRKGGRVAQGTERGPCVQEHVLREIRGRVGRNPGEEDRMH